MEVLTAVKATYTAKKTLGKSFGKVILGALFIPIALLLISMTCIIYILTSPLSSIMENVMAISHVEFPDAIKDLKSQTHFITYCYKNESWRGKSPPTYNNKIVEDYSEDEYDEEGNLVSEGHDSITFGGTSLFFKRYAYATDVGTITEITDNSITILHQWGTCNVNGAEHLSYYNVTYTNVEYDKKYCDKLEVGQETYPGQKLYKIKLFKNMDFSVRRICHDPKNVNPHDFIVMDNVEFMEDPKTDGGTQ